MTADIEIERREGSVRIVGCPLALRAELSRTEVNSALSRHYHNSIDHRNGYVWDMYRKLCFAGLPCGLGVCFYRERLKEVHLGVSLPNIQLEGGWPTRAAIDAEIDFMRSTFSSIFGVSFASGSRRFDWGQIWSTFDAKGFQASSGIRYAP